MAHVRQDPRRQLGICRATSLPSGPDTNRAHTHTDGQHSATVTDAQSTNRHKRYRRTHGGDRGWRWVQHERETVRRPSSHERAVRVLAAPSGRARVACIFRLTARVRLLAPSAPVSGLAPAQIPPKGRLGPLREDKSGFCQKSTSRFCVLRHLSIIREFLNGPRPPGGSSASAEPPHSRLHHG